MEHATAPVDVAFDAELVRAFGIGSDQEGDLPTVQLEPLEVDRRSVNRISVNQTRGRPRNGPPADKREVLGPLLDLSDERPWWFASHLEENRAGRSTRAYRVGQLRGRRRCRAGCDSHENNGRRKPIPAVAGLEPNADLRAHVSPRLGSRLVVRVVPQSASSQIRADVTSTHDPATPRRSLLRDGVLLARVPWRKARRHTTTSSRRRSRTRRRRPRSSRPSYRFDILSTGRRCASNQVFYPRRTTPSGTPICSSPSVVRTPTPTCWSTFCSSTRARTTASCCCGCFATCCVFGRPGSKSRGPRSCRCRPSSRSFCPTMSAAGRPRDTSTTCSPTTQVREGSRIVSFRRSRSRSTISRRSRTTSSLRADCRQPSRSRCGACATDARLIGCCNTRRFGPRRLPPSSHRPTACGTS